MNSEKSESYSDQSELDLTAPTKENLFDRMLKIPSRIADAKPQEQLNSSDEHSATLASFSDLCTQIRRVIGKSENPTRAKSEISKESVREILSKLSRDADRGKATLVSDSKTGFPENPESGCGTFEVGVDDATERKRHKLDVAPLLAVLSRAKAAFSQESATAATARSVVNLPATSRKAKTPHPDFSTGNCPISATRSLQYAADSSNFRTFSSAAQPSPDIAPLPPGLTETHAIRPSMPRPSSYPAQYCVAKLPPGHPMRPWASSIPQSSWRMNASSLEHTGFKPPQRVSAKWLAEVRCLLESRPLRNLEPIESESWVGGAQTSMVDAETSTEHDLDSDLPLPVSARNLTAVKTLIKSRPLRHPDPTHSESPMVDAQSSTVDAHSKVDANASKIDAETSTERLEESPLEQSKTTSDSFPQQVMELGVQAPVPDASTTCPVKVKEEVELSSTPEMPDIPSCSSSQEEEPERKGESDMVKERLASNATSSKEPGVKPSLQPTVKQEVLSSTPSSEGATREDPKTAQRAPPDKERQEPHVGKPTESSNELLVNLLKELADTGKGVKGEDDEISIIKVTPPRFSLKRRRPVDGSPASRDVKVELSEKLSTSSQLKSRLLVEVSDEAEDRSSSEILGRLRSRSPVRREKSPKRAEKSSISPNRSKSSSSRTADSKKRRSSSKTSSSKDKAHDTRHFADQEPVVPKKAKRQKSPSPKKSRSRSKRKRSWSRDREKTKKSRSSKSERKSRSPKRKRRIRSRESRSDRYLKFVDASKRKSSSTVCSASPERPSSREKTGSQKHQNPETSSDYTNFILEKLLLQEEILEIESKIEQHRKDTLLKFISGIFDFKGDDEDEIVAKLEKFVRDSSYNREVVKKNAFLKGWMVVLRQRKERLLASNPSLFRSVDEITLENEKLWQVVDIFRELHLFRTLPDFCQYDSAIFDLAIAQFESKLAEKRSQCSKTATTGRNDAFVESIFDFIFRLLPMPKPNRVRTNENLLRCLRLLGNACVKLPLETEAYKNIRGEIGDFF